MWLPSWKKDEFFVVVWNAWWILRKGTVPRLQCLFSLDKHSRRQHSCVLRHTNMGAPRSVISTSMERYASCVKFQAPVYQTTLTVYLHKLPWDSTFNSKCVRSVDTPAFNNSSSSSSSSKVHGPGCDEMLHGFIFLSLCKCSVVKLVAKKKCSMSAHSPYRKQVVVVSP